MVADLQPAFFYIAGESLFFTVLAAMVAVMLGSDLVMYVEL